MCNTVSCENVYFDKNKSKLFFDILLYNKKNQRRREAVSLSLLSRAPFAEFEKYEVTVNATASQCSIRHIYVSGFNRDRSTIGLRKATILQTFAARTVCIYLLKKKESRAGLRFEAK